MMFGWGSPRLMRGSLPNNELVILEKFYEDYLKLMGFTKKDPDEEDPSEDFDSEVIVVTPTEQ